MTTLAFNVICSSIPLANQGLNQMWSIPLINREIEWEAKKILAMNFINPIQTSKSRFDK